MPPSTEVPTIANSESRTAPLTREPSHASLTANVRDPGSALAIIGRRWKVLIVLALPLLLESFDQTITATAQPHIASSFGRLDLQTWIGTAFMLTVTAFLPLYANIADVFGRFWAFFWSLVIFLLGSCICTGAQNMPVLLLGRGITGVGGAGITAVTRVIISDVRSLDDNATQATIMVSLQGLGYIIGPLVGGGLTSISWRYIFAMNIPITVLSIFLLFGLLRDSLVGPRAPSVVPTTSSPHEPVQMPLTVQPLTLPQKLARVDWLGAFVLITASILLLFGLSSGSTSISSSWTAPSTIGSLVTGGLVTAAFPLCEWLLRANSTYQVQRSTSVSIVRKLRSKWVSYTKGVEPMIPLALFTNRDVWVSYFNALICGMMLFGCLYFLSTYFVIVVGYSIVRSSVQLLVVSPGLGIGSYLGIYMIKVMRQPRFPILVGSGMMPIIAGLLSYAIRHDMRATVDGLLVLAGFAIGIQLGPLALQAQYSHTAQHAAVLVTLNLFFRNLGGTIGLAQLSAVLESHIRTYIRHVVETGAVSSADANLIYSSLSSLSGSPSSSSSSGGVDSLPSNLKDIIVTAYKDGTADAFISLLPWCASGFALCALLRNITEPLPEEPTSQPLELRDQAVEDESRTVRQSVSDNRSGLTGLPTDSIRSAGTSIMPLVEQVDIRI